jgi:hypothetical protein
MFIPKEGSGSLFKNDQGDNPARPKYKGDIMLGGVLYEIAGWVKPKTSNPSENFLSLVGKAKEQQASKPVAKSAPALELDDDMPF